MKSRFERSVGTDDSAPWQAAPCAEPCPHSGETKPLQQVLDALIGVPLGDSPRFGVGDFLEVGDKSWPDVVRGREFLGDVLEAFPRQTVLDVLATDIDQSLLQ